MSKQKSKPATSLAWAVRVGIYGCSYYFAGPSTRYPKGAVAPLNCKKQPLALIFESETEAEIARDAYLMLNADPFEATVVQVKAQPTHRLTDEGFAPMPLAMAMPLFAETTNPLDLIY